MPVSAADRAAWQAAMARPFTSPLPAAPTAKPVMSAADRQAWAQQMANINPNMSGLEDVGRTLVSRPQRMVAGAVGMPRSV
ncbi:MAG TPA: hypothetical protein VN806_08400, partial [Caulobacteraceae bacterium]|nr:hypothetical protein [Caulobacteraceae bacterium]